LELVCEFEELLGVALELVLPLLVLLLLVLFFDPRQVVVATGTAVWTERRRGLDCRPLADGSQGTQHANQQKDARDVTHVWSEHRLNYNERTAPLRRPGPAEPRCYNRAPMR